MKNCRVIVVSMYLIIVSPVHCISRKIKSVSTKEFHRSGEPIALNNFIQKYEEEHQRFYEEEIKNDVYLKWSALNNKNLSNYCKEYLGYCVPTRTTANATGIKNVRPLHYVENRTNPVRLVVIVQCRIMNKNSPFRYYITRAPKPNCVYSLKSIGSSNQPVFTIINKHCNFEGNQSIYNSLKRKRGMNEIVSRMHRQTGQPIAKDIYLLEYELEHQGLLKMEGEEGYRIVWLQAIQHHDLDSYCYQYMKECVPKRERKGVTGSWKFEQLNYQKLKSNKDIDITLVTCVPLNSVYRRYHLTRAPDTNCVFALLRKWYKLSHHFVIVFKHCDFEDLHSHQGFFKNSLFPEENKISKTEIKKEKDNTLGTLQLFPED